MSPPVPSIPLYFLAIRLQEDRTIKKEGVIRFSYECVGRRRHYPDHEKRLISLRNWLRALRLIGQEGGVGYGNVSIRTPAGTFLITASQTGHREDISSGELVEIIHYDFLESFVRCAGAGPPSSETLTHAAVYDASPRAGCVAHVHSAELWKRMYGRVPTTSPDALYGTPQLALGIRDIVSSSNGLPEILVLGGHRDGLLLVGRGCGDVRDVVSAIFPFPPV